MLAIVQRGHRRPQFGERYATAAVRIKFRKCSVWVLIIVFHKIVYVIKIINRGCPSFRGRSLVLKLFAWIKCHQKTKKRDEKLDHARIAKLVRTGLGCLETHGSYPCTGEDHFPYDWGEKIVFLDISDREEITRIVGRKEPISVPIFSTRTNRCNSVYGCQNSIIPISVRWLKPIRVIRPYADSIRIIYASLVVVC